MFYLKKITELLNSKYIFNLYILSLIVFLISLVGLRSSLIFISIQILIILLCILFINERPGLNLSNSFYGFTMIFLGLFPIAEYKLGIIYWGGKSISDFTYIEASFYVLLSIIFFRLGYEIKIKSKTIYNSNIYLNHKIFTKMLSWLSLKTFLFLTIPCLYILAAYNYDFIALQFRGMGEEIETVFIFEFFFIKPLIFNIIFFFLIVHKSSGLKNKIILLFYFIVLIFFVNPLSIPRFLAFSLFVPLVFVLSKYYLKTNFAYLNVVFFGMIFIFLYGFCFAYPRNRNSNFESTKKDINCFDICCRFLCFLRSISYFTFKSL